MKNGFFKMWREFQRIHGKLGPQVFLRKILTVLLSPFLGKPTYAKRGLYFYCPSKSDKYVFHEVWGIDSLYGHPKIMTYLNNGVVFDVGAHKGYFTLLASKHATTVVAVEPVKGNYSYLSRHKHVNLLSNVTTVNMALDSSCGHVEMHLSSLADARHSVYKTKFIGKCRVEIIKTTTIVDLMKKNNVDTINLLKIDCEGCEYELIFSSAEWLHKVSAIALEIHEATEINYKKEQLRDYLEEQGFSVEFYSARSFDDFSVWMAFCYRN